MKIAGGVLPFLLLTVLITAAAAAPARAMDEPGMMAPEIRITNAYDAFGAERAGLQLGFRPHRR